MGKIIQLFARPSGVATLDSDRRVGVYTAIQSPSANYAYGVPLTHLVSRRTDNAARNVLQTRSSDGQDESTRSRVEATLTLIMPTGNVGVERVAKHLGLSRQTLARRLKAEDTTYERVLDDLRHQMAVNYLSAGNSVKEITFLVGFSDPASFSRAFKRWTGLSPSGRERRRNDGENDDAD